MKIILTATTDGLAAAWERFCGRFPDVEIYRGSILDLEVDAVVSPANSFGFMDGGIDKVYAAAFPHVQDHLQDEIKAKFNGELLVGQAVSVGVTHPRIAHLIAAPTMRVPMVLVDSINPFLAARAALLLAVGDGLKSIAFPGLGTGVGRVPVEVCGRQMQAAIEAMYGHSQFPASWREAQCDHQLMYTGRVRDLQNGD